MCVDCVCVRALLLGKAHPPFADAPAGTSAPQFQLLLRNTIPKTRRRNPRRGLLFLAAEWCPRRKRWSNINNFWCKGDLFRRSLHFYAPPIINCRRLLQHVHTPTHAQNSSWLHMQKYICFPSWNSGVNIIHLKILPWLRISCGKQFGTLEKPEGEKIQLNKPINQHFAVFFPLIHRLFTDGGCVQDQRPVWLF